MALIEKDKIELSTPLGKREIQIHVGDITKLRVEEKVDVVITSAFYGEDAFFSVCTTSTTNAVNGDYSPVYSTLIGSLSRNLNISVHHLAKCKELDLRLNFSCWVSKLLQADLPFRRLVCFELNRKKANLTEQLCQMFRAMMPILGNTDTSIITPLLASGDQGYSALQSLAGMVNGACEWIKAGLPIKCLKIVLYSDDTSRLSDINSKCLNLFASLKNKWHELENMTETESGPYDICLSYSPADLDLARKVRQSLLKQNRELKIHSDLFVFNPNDVWQKEIYSVLSSSKRILAILTPAYIDDALCLEQFSMALCCNRLKKEEVLFPFYLQTVNSVPSYMSLVQYTECRVRKEDESAEELLDLACSNLIYSIKDRHTESLSSEDNQDAPDGEALRRSKDTVYDVFVSYSHSCAQLPKELVQVLQRNHPELNVFFDLSELKAGNLWQQALYEAVDKALCIVVFLSPGYIKSSVCNEEFNIALGRHFAQDSIIFVPIYNKDVESIPRRFTSLPSVDIGDGVEGVAHLATKLVKMVNKRKEKTGAPNVIFLKQKLQNKRALDFKAKFRLEGGQVVRILPAPVVVNGNVVFSYAPEHLSLAAIMSVIMTKANPGLTCQLQATTHSQRRTQLDSADLVVLFISDLLISSQHLVEELHTVLCRQRTTNDRTILYLIQCAHNAAAPFYFHLLPFSISLDDNIWRRLERASSNKNPKYAVDVAGMAGMYRCTVAQNLALTAAAHDAAYVLSQGGSGSSVRCSLDNIACLESDLEGGQDDLVSAKDHIVMLTSFSHMMSRQHTISPSLKPVIKSSSPADSDVNQFLTDSNDNISSLQQDCHLLPSEDVSSNILNSVETSSISTVILKNDPSEIGIASENKVINDDQTSTLGEKQLSRLDINSDSAVDQITTSGGRLPETTSGVPSTKGPKVLQQEQPTKHKQGSGTCCVL